MDDHEFGSKLDGVDYTDRPGAYGVIETDAGLIAVIDSGRGWFLPDNGMCRQTFTRIASQALEGEK
ncbi:MAG: hypothetical protein R2844_14795 [Caldilineales bacterium]